MTTLLPSPLPLFSPSLLPQGKDPLAAMLERSIPAGLYQFPPSEEVVWGILSALSQVPFDPNTTCKTQAGQAVSALEGALRLVRPHAPRRSFRVWPTTPEAFTPQLLQAFEDRHGQMARDTVDGEWLAAMLLSVGANPWQGAPNGALSGCFNKALSLGMVGLVDRMWSMTEGRPSLETFSSATGEMDQTQGTWLENAVRRSDAELTQWLLQQGVRPLHGQLHPMALAESLDHVNAFIQHDALPQSPAEIRAVKSAWRDRLKRGQLRAELSVRFLEALSPTVPSQEGAPAPDLNDQARAARFEQILARGKWSVSFPPSLISNLGSKAFEQATIAKGPLAGTWTRLSVEVVSHLRPSHTRGVVPFDLGQTFRHVFHDGTGWDTASPETHPGALAGVLGVEWRPGLKNDGLFALALLGMSDIVQLDSVNRFVTGALKPQPLVGVGAGLLGVSDLKAWATEHAEAAVAFTEALTKGSGSSACARLTTIWATALERHPTWLVERPDLGARLLSALTGSFKHVVLLRTSDTKEVLLSNDTALGGVALALWPGLDPASPPSLKSLSPGRVSLAVELGLMVHSSAWVKTLAEGLAVLSPEDRKRIEVCEALVRKNPNDYLVEGKPLANLLRLVLLDQALPAAAPAVPKPRF